MSVCIRLIFFFNLFLFFLYFHFFTGNVITTGTEFVVKGMELHYDIQAFSEINVCNLYIDMRCSQVHTIKVRKIR